MSTTTHRPTAEAGIGRGPASSASVALDIGPGRGALVILPAARWRDREIEISRKDGVAHRVHTGVHEREAHAGAVLTAIFGSLPAGDYIIWEDAVDQADSVTVSEARVAEIELP
jgi:hypothetical protein